MSCATFHTFSHSEAPTRWSLKSYDKQFEEDVKKGHFNDLRQWPNYIHKLSTETLHKFKDNAKFPFLKRSIEEELGKRQSFWNKFIKPIYDVGISKVKQWIQEAKEQQLQTFEQIRKFVRQKMSSAAPAALPATFKHSDPFMPSEDDVEASMSLLNAIAYVVLLFINVHLFRKIVETFFPDMSEESITRMIGMITFIMDD